MIQKNAIRDLKNFKTNKLVPKQLRDVLGDIVAASADPLSDLIDKAQDLARDDVRSLSQTEDSKYDNDYDLSLEELLDALE
jgi:hypothetical protein